MMDEPNTTTTPETTAKPIPPASVVAWREAMGFTSRDASEALGCSRQALLNWEHGTNECPRYIGLAMAALALGMTPYGVEEKNNV